MTKEGRIPNDEELRLTRVRWVIRASSFVRHSCFVIRHWVCPLAVLLLAPIIWAADEPKPAAPQPIAIKDVKHRSPVDFESEVLPILKANCLACHNQTSTKADLVLETPQTIRKGGESGAAVVPGKPSESLLLQLASHQKRPTMPPKDNKVAASELKPEELGLIKLWIEQGAKGEVRASIPVVWRPLPKTIHPIYAAAVTRDGQFAACGRGNQIFVYHLPSTQLVARLTDPKIGKGSEAAHLDLVQSLDFSPDGKLLASGAFREVKLWRRSLESKTVKLANTSPVFDLTGDGKTLAVLTASNQISIRDPRTGNERQKLSSSAASIARLSFSPDAKTLAGLPTNGALEIWNAKEAKLVAKTNLPGTTNLFAWLSAKEFATASGDPAIQVWQLSDSPTQALALTKTLTPPAPVTLLAGAMNRIVSCDSNGAIRVWDVNKAEKIRQFQPGGAITALALSGDAKRIASAGMDKAIRFWSDQGEQVAQVKGDRYLNEALQAAERTATLASNEVAFRKTSLQTAETQRTNEWKRITKATETNAVAQKTFIEKEKKFAATRETKAAAEKVVADLQAQLGKCAPMTLTNATNSLAASITNAPATVRLTGVLTSATSQQTNQIAASATNTSVAAKAPSAKEIEAKLKDAMARVTSASNEWAAAEKDFKKAELAKSIITHELELATNALAKAEQAVKEGRSRLEKSETGGKERREAIATAAKRTAAAEQITTLLAFSPDGQLLASADKAFALHTWSAQSGAAFDVYRTTNGPIGAISFPAPMTLIAAGSGTLSQWNLRPVWRLERTIGGDKIESPFADRINAVRFSPDGTLLATGGGQPSRSGEIKLWNVADGKLQRDLPSIHSDAVFALDFSPDGALLASGAADKFLRVSSVPSGKLVKSFEGHTHHVLGVGWKQDGRTVASAGADALVKLWNFTTGERLKNVEGFGKEVTSVAFVGVTGQFLACSGDGQLRLVKENAENVKGYTGATDYLYCAAATPDGNIVVAGGQDGILRVWSGDGKSLASFAP